ncbi:AcrB/AcrD/AcrF family protein [Amycolatopsis balhimycina DSM 5908]|uniref:AcrB/AcrD/AcrF family protein n=1 Tax=Amycolatopsis balhimycina DSM 5908 TaxID=1081091 RepID=A0A428WYW6_AMYBA|nr:efflux RND transporter permease subunit [Amycolatopsis balhimycina]RSM48249.1 AcrB/AcrD/AcrF family protein [Amycolatopsis balhimycina DSM 5908]
MLRWIVGSSLKGRFLVLALAGALLFFGSLQLKKSPVDVFPEFAPPRVEVQTLCVGLNTAEVESLVTVPLEQAFNGVAGIDTIRSKSVSGVSSIEMIFKQGTDVINAEQLVSERIGTVSHQLPTWAAPPVIRPPLSATSRAMHIGVSSKTVGLLDLSNIAYWTLRSRILRVPGVANVAIWGERLDLQQVQVDPKRLKAQNVTLTQVMEAASNAVDSGLLQFTNGAVLGTGGFVDTPNQRLGLQNLPPIVTTKDLAEVSVPRPDGTSVRLGDVADVLRDHPPLIGDAVINDGTGLMLVVEKFPWGNALDVDKGVEQAIDEMRPGLQGIDIDTTIFRPATFIQAALGNLTTSMVIGALLLVLMLGLFLWDWRTALISVVAIPLSVVTVGLILDSQGYTINTMILAGLVIALGDVVDDAIVDVENVFRRLKQHRAENPEATRRATARVILSASIEVRKAIIYATAIEVAAVSPVILLPGLSGSFFRPLALAYSLAILASMSVALTVTPALCLILLRKTKFERRESPVVRWLAPRYTRLLQRVVRHPYRAFAGAGVVLIAGIVVFPLLSASLFPEFKERGFLIHWITKPGTSLAEERRIVESISKDLRAIPGVRNFGSHIGQAFLAEEIAGVDFGENWISIDPDVDYESTVAAVEDVVNSYPGMFHNVETYLAERIDEVLTGSSYPITVRIFGTDLPTMRAKADEVRKLLADVPGTTDAKVELQQDEPQLQVTVNLDAAQKYGLKPGDVRRAAGTLVAGEEVGDIYRGGKTYDVQVWSTPQTRQSVTDIGNLVLDTPTNTQVKLSDVADIRVVPVPNSIRHENTARRIDVTANVSGRDLNDVVGDVQQKLRDVQYPQGFHAELLGTFQERQAAQNQILLVAIGAAVAILLLLHSAFRNWRMTVLAFVALPMAVVGGILAALINGGMLSLGALVGLFTVFGIAARNGIMLISHFHHLNEVEGMPFGVELVLRGSRERLRPIVMTALATGLAVLPLVVAGDIPGHEIEHPMAVVIAGGLVTSTLLNLFVLPALYLRFGKAGRPAEIGSSHAPQHV